MDELLWIADYERRGVEAAMEALQEKLETVGGDGEGGKKWAARWMDALRQFVTVADLYGQVYVLKDVGTRTR
jgi:hypothetical protein